MDKLLDQLAGEQKRLFTSLDTPIKIQEFLNSVQYPGEDRNRCPVNVMKDRKAHCLDGAMFAVAALRRIGHPPLILDLYPEPGMDDDHVLAIYKVGGFWGALAKSNFVGLRFREPVYRSLRELVMSYFDVFFNLNGLRTLRSYSRPVNLKRFDHTAWEVHDSGIDQVEEYLKHLPSTPILSPAQAAQLHAVDKASFDAGMSIANPEGLYNPKR